MSKKKKQICYNIGSDELVNMLSMGACVTSASGILTRLMSIAGISILMIWINKWIVLGLISAYLLLLLIYQGIRFIKLKKKLCRIN